MLSWEWRRHKESYRDTPIIAMTANAFAEDKAQCLAAGMNDFLIEPHNPDDLVAVVLRSLKRTEEFFTINTIWSVVQSLHISQCDHSIAYLHSKL